MSATRPNKASLALIACFCIGGGCAALGGRDAVDRTIDGAAIEAAAA